MATSWNGVDNWKARVIENGVTNNNNGTVTVYLRFQIQNVTGGTLRKADYTFTGYGSSATFARDVANTKGAISTGDQSFVVSKSTSAYTRSYSGFRVRYNDKPYGGSITSNYYSLSGSVAFTIPALSNYTIAYNANGGDSVPDNQTKREATTLYLTSEEATRVGHTFLRWNTNAAGTGTNYSPGGAYTANTGATLYAQWQINSYTLTANANGGSVPETEGWTISGSNATKSVTYNDAYGNLPVPVRPGYKFLGWFTEAEGGDEVTAETIMGAEDAEIYAHWKSLVYAKVDGTWIPGPVSVKVDGAWKEMDTIYVKVNGEWKEI